MKGEGYVMKGNIKLLIILTWNKKMLIPMMTKLLQAI
jgi:hypothetical protein